MPSLVLKNNKNNTIIVIIKTYLKVCVNFAYFIARKQQKLTQFKKKSINFCKKKEVSSC